MGGRACRTHTRHHRPNAEPRQRLSSDSDQPSFYQARQRSRKPFFRAHRSCETDFNEASFGQSEREISARNTQTRKTKQHGTWDVVIRISTDNDLLLPPAAVISNQDRIPDSPSQFQCFLRVRNDLLPLPVADAERYLVDVGYPSAQLRSNHYVRSLSLRAELLALWNL